jgi:electron transfer flavoprotein beta subunit
LALAVLVSIGRHPASGRSRRADRDARALELALRLRAHGARSLDVVHAGDPDEPALREYLGMGLERLIVLDTPPGTDPLPALTGYLQRSAPDMVLTGSAAESGPCSGFLPYRLAAALDYALAPGIAAAALEQDGRVGLLQALPRGRRRSLAARPPLLVTVDKAGPVPRAVAYGPARRGHILVQAAAVSVDSGHPPWAAQPARARQRRLRAVTGGSAAERLRAVTETPAGRGQLLVHPAPDEAAAAIYRYLVEEGIISGKVERGAPPSDR